MVPETDSVSIKKFVLISYQNPARGDGISLRHTSLTKPLTWLAAQQDISDILKTHKLILWSIRKILQFSKIILRWKI